MKKFLALISTVLVTSVSAMAVTQVVVALESPSLPADAFRPAINKAVYDLTVTDIPAIVAAVNEKVDAAGTAAVTMATTQLTFTAVGVAAGTNSAAVGFKVRLNGTNYIMNLFPN